jgi:signal peptidase II
MTPFRRILLLTTVLLTSLGCDEITKITARNYLSSSQPTSYLGGIFRLQYTENTGAFLSLGSALPSDLRFWGFTILMGIALAGMLAVVLAHRSLHPNDITGLSLIVAGGLGNLIDRALHNGAVIDFMNIGVGSLRTGIFNIADVAIMVGAGLLIFRSFQQIRWQRTRSK